MTIPSNGKLSAPSQRGAEPQTEIKYAARRKLMVDRAQLEALAHDVKEELAAGNSRSLRELLDRTHPADVADVMTFLDEGQDRQVFDLLDVPEQAQVLDEVDHDTRDLFARSMPAERLAEIVAELPSDEAADVLGCLEPEGKQAVLAELDAGRSSTIGRLLAYPAESAGGIMATGYVAVDAGATVAEALRAYAENDATDLVTDVYVVDKQGLLLGQVSLRALLRSDPASPVRSHTATVPVTVPPDMDQEQVARIFARYDLTTVPVVDRAPGGRLIGIVTADDIIDVIEEEGTEDALRMAGSDAEEMERRSPARTALLRLPWIMATMFIELGAGLVIHFFDATLARVLLLASFMPIISAISGNTGLQSATIIVRGLSTDQVRTNEWRRAVRRQLTMTLILGAVAGVTLGTIGALWYGKIAFGLVVATGMFAAVNIAGFVGTVVPLISRHFGFDPAITSGPFETAFQDVVGISIFLGLATLMLHYLTTT